MLVKLNDGYGLGNTLLCPCCGGEYLHHDTVSVFMRPEDAESTLVTTVSATASITDLLPSNVSGNPSSRRGGITISFWCESCHGDPEHINKPLFKLHIAQHKGNTFLNWKV